MRIGGRRFFLSLTILTASVCLALGLFYGVALVVIHLPVFPVRDVNVTGSLAHVTHAQLDAVVHRELRGNFFTISLEASGEAFEKLPWVRQVRLRRQWPDRLDVTLEEHEALARWGSEGLVNTHGEVFTAASDAHLPVFTGPIDVAPEIATQYARFQTALSPLGRQVAEIQVSDRRAWRIHLTERSRQVVDKVRSGLAGMEEEMLAGLDQHQRDSLSDLLERVRANFVEARTPGVIVHG